MMVERCSAKTKGGKPCDAKPRPGTAFCPWHDPALTENRSEWSAKGGANRSNQARAKKDLPTEPLTNAEVHAYLSLAFRQTLVGKMEPGVLNALSTASKALADLSGAVDVAFRAIPLRGDLLTHPLFLRLDFY
jgi:hypothetical protein